MYSIYNKRKKQNRYYFHLLIFMLKITCAY